MPILRGIENHLYQQSFLPMLTDVQNDRSRFERYLEMLLGRRVEGLIVIANWLFTDVNLLADLQKNSIPTVMIGRELEDESVSSVIVDNEAGGAAAFEHLYSLGHRQIAIIRGPKTLTDSAPRWDGIRGSARSKNLEIDPQLVMQLPESSDPMSGFEYGQRLTSELIKKQKAFSAILAFDDMSAFGAVRALVKAGIRVPDQCSVIGFDDISPASIYTPALTTIRQPLEPMGSLSVQILLEALQAQHDGKAFTALHRKLSPQLVVRETTTAISR
jgi:LacI family transcriptional regulator